MTHFQEDTEGFANTLEVGPERMTRFGLVCLGYWDPRLGGGLCLDRLSLGCLPDFPWGRQLGGEAARDVGTDRALERQLMLKAMRPGGCN